MERIEIGHWCWNFKQDIDIITTGTKIWPSSLVLSNYLYNQQNKINFKGKRCIELGSGCGVGGVTLAHLGSNVTCTDLKSIINLLKDNVSRNTFGLKNSVTVTEHEWGTDVSSLQPPFDIIIGTDIVYKQDYIDPLIISLISLSDSNTLIFIALENRCPTTYDYFIKKINQYLKCTKISKIKVNFNKEFVKIFTLEKK